MSNIEWYVWVAIVFGYCAIGAFVSGFIDTGNDYPDILTVVLWPFLCVALAIMSILKLPFILGSWISDRFN